MLKMQRFKPKLSGKLMIYSIRCFCGVWRNTVNKVADTPFAWPQMNKQENKLMLLQVLAEI